MELTIQQQHDWAALAVQQSKNFEVVTQQDYDNAAELCKDLKNRVNQITDYWKPLKSKAYDAWKDVCAKEKELLNPFTTAESSLKEKMRDFQRQQLEIERERREALERQKREEAEMLLKEAAKAEAEGDIEKSGFMFEAAENAQNAPIEEPKPWKTAGTSRRVIWRARVTNPALVPVTVAGAIIRPIDAKVLNELARISKGNLTIPGVQFYEDVQVGVRTR